MQFMGLQFRPIVEFMPAIWEGLQLTFVLAVAGIILGATAGLLLAIWGFMMPRKYSWPIRVYVEAIRNTPLLVQLYIIFLGLPAIGLHFSALQASVIGLTINLGAYSTEIFRAGFDSIKRPQIEAGQALGFSQLQVLRHVALVPAVSRVWPSLIGQFILMTLGTSICSFISVTELTGTAYNIQSATFLSLQVFIVVGALYLCLIVLMKTFFAILGALIFPDKSLSLGKGGTGAKALMSSLRRLKTP